MALTGIDVILAEVVALFDPLVVDGTLQTNLDFPPLAEDLAGQSPILATYYDGTRIKFHGASYSEVRHIWRIALFVNRRGHGNDNAETLTAQIVTKVIQKIRDNVAGTAYDEIALAPGLTRPLFAIIDGIPYRICEIKLESVTHDN